MRVVFSFFTTFLFVVFSSHVNAYSVTDSNGTHEFESVPQRVVVLDWSLLEQVIELGVTPVGAPELESYADWVVKPAIPQATENVGTRSEPNLEKISALHPDLILISDTQNDVRDKLESIAPVLYYHNFSSEQDHASVAMQQFLQLSDVFQKRTLAQDKLAKLDCTLNNLRAQLEQAFGATLPNVVLMRFANVSSTFIYTQGSIPVYVLRRLGLGVALEEAPAKWGIVQQPLTALKNISQGYVLYILPFNEEEKLQESILWKMMPFVRAGHVNAVDSVWSYGGAMSIQYTAQAVTQALLEVAPK